jgi:hypothetical protein
MEASASLNCGGRPVCRPRTFKALDLGPHSSFGAGGSARVPSKFPPSSLGSLLYIWLEPNCRLPRLGAGRSGVSRGTSVLSRQYFVRQAAALLQFAKETTNPQLAAVLVEKAADLKSQIDEFGAAPDPDPQTPDAQPES